MNDVKRINKQLRKIASGSGRSQTDLAMSSDCSQATISAFLSGRTDLGHEIAKRLASTLGYRLSMKMELTKWQS